MDNKIEEIKEAYKAGQDKRKNGANEENCDFRFFSSKEKCLAWEQGSAGQKLSVKIIEITN